MAQFRTITDTLAEAGSSEANPIATGRAVAEDPALSHPAKSIPRQSRCRANPYGRSRPHRFPAGSFFGSFPTPARYLSVTPPKPYPPAVISVNPSAPCWLSPMSTISFREGQSGTAGSITASLATAITICDGLPRWQRDADRNNVFHRQARRKLR